MADKSISELIPAEQVTPLDLFVLEQNNTAKKLTGQILENWLLELAQGRGGIQTIEKTSTSGLVDTYTITFSNQTTTTFTVTNGKSITGIAKTGTSGLVDTYTITYNNGESTTFTVTNGAKGDTGNSWYVWIKYASQKPTSESHSIGDVPDNWMGIYSGTQSEAPADWQEYTWFEIKGQQGNTGSPATVSETKVEYQVSASGTITPSGSWQQSIPTTPQGQYLWTRTTVRFNTGSPVVSYSVSRMGLDGSGSVVSVNGESPDAEGNVKLPMDDTPTPDSQKLISSGAVARALDELKVSYGNLVVFGNSLGAGMNNDNRSFVDILSERGNFTDVKKHCVSGATIGPYSIDPEASGYSLIEQITTHSEDVEAADIIMLEYGANDVWASLQSKVQMGNKDDTSSETTVCGYAKKAMENIQALNPKARIIWLAFSWNNFELLKAKIDVGFADAEMLFEATAMQAIREYLSAVIPVMEGLSPSDFSSDGQHPNTQGHEKIADKILTNMFETPEFPPLKRNLVLGGDLSDSGSLSFESKFSAILNLLNARVTVEAVNMYQSIYPVKLYPVMYNQYMILFSGCTYDGRTLTDIAIAWSELGSQVILTVLKSAPFIHTVNLPAENWSGEGTFTQAVSIPGVSSNSKINVNPDATLLQQAMNDGFSLVFGNNNGTATAYAVGAKPTTALNVTVDVQEVEVQSNG